MSHPSPKKPLPNWPVICAVAFLCMVNPRHLSGQSSSNAIPPPASLKLSGKVVATDGKPAVRALVVYTAAGQPRTGPQRAASSTETDDLGRFTFDAVGEGPVTVSVNYGNSSGRLPAKGGDTNLVIKLALNMLDSPRTVPPLKVSGTVRDPSGKPADGVTVSVLPTFGREIKVETDAGGRYEISWPRRNTIEQPYWLMATDLPRELAAIREVSESATNLDLSLQETLTLSTKVQDSHGRTVNYASATVMLLSDRSSAVIKPQPFLTDEEGRLRITGLPQGQNYTIRVEARGHTYAVLSVDADDAQTNHLELPPAILWSTDRKVSGIVLDPEHNTAPAVRIILTMMVSGGNATTTDPAGRFFVEEASRGPVTVHANMRGFAGVAEVKAGDTDAMTLIQLEAAAKAITTSGKVFDPLGAWASGVLLSVSPGYGTTTVQSDWGGNYAAPWLPTSAGPNEAGHYFLVGRDPAHNLAAMAKLDTTTTALDLHLQPGLTLAGVVQTADGSPVPHASVQITLFAGNPQGSTNTGAQGLFSISALPQGATFEVNVAAPGYGSNSISLRPTDTQTTQLKLPPIVLQLANRQLAGQVIGVDDKPCWGAQVTISGEGQPAGHAAGTDANGHFVLKHVCEGPLVVRATLPAGNGNPRPATATVHASGGDTNIVIKLAATGSVLP